MEIKPFKALRYDSSAVGDIGCCISPPYDVIDPDMQQSLYDKNPCNIVRVIKGKTEPTDNENNNQYTRAAESLNGWIKNGALKTDSQDTIYGYIQNFDIESGRYRRSGFVALGRLEEFGSGVQPHEKTLDGPKADRLKLTTATAAQFGQIFMLYDDPSKTADAIMEKAAAKPALIDFNEPNGNRHRLFAIDDPAEIAAIAGTMRTLSPVIADGHHRYETALNYYKQTQNPAAQYRMMTFVNMRNEGLVVLPTHRLIANLPDFDIDKLIASLKDTFEITEYSFADDNEKKSARQKMFDDMKARFENNQNAFGIYAGNNVFYIALLASDKAMAAMCPDMSNAAKTLDVNILHKLILENALGIGDKQLATQSNIEYIKDIGNAIEAATDKIDSGQRQVAFFMNPTRIQQVKDIADAGEKMPQKSTFFYPKVYTGLVINKL